MDDRFAPGDLPTLFVNRDEHRLVECGDQQRRQVFLGSTAQVAGFVLLEADAQRRLAIVRRVFALRLGHLAPVPRAAVGVDHRLAEAEFCSYIRAAACCQYSNTISRKNHV
jgi:hypothetical protein